MRDHHHTALKLPQSNESWFAVIEAGIFECDARSGEHGVCIIKAETVLGQILSALGYIPFIDGTGPLIALQV